MSDRISHSGIIERIEGDTVCVRIVQTAACAACKVAGQCHASEAKEKLVDVYHVDTRALAVGDRVTVAASSQVARQALLLGFGIPFLILVGFLIAVLRATGNEAIAALSGLAALVPYYFVLYLLRDRLRSRLSFFLE